MNDAPRVLAEHNRCCVTLQGQRLIAQTRRATGHMMGAVLLLTLGILMCIGMTVMVAGIAVQSGFEANMLIAPFMGTPFIVVGAYTFATLRRRWGEVVIDLASQRISWRQGEQERGSWPLSDYLGLRHRHAFLTTYRVRFAKEQWLTAELRGGVSLPLLLGYSEETRAVADVLANVPVSR